MMLAGIRQMELLDTNMPEIKGDFDVLIRMQSVGVCGSDVHYYTQGRIGSQIVEYPFAVGHEGAGVVEKVGSKVTNVRKGDRIAIEPAMPCFECDQCKAGRHNTCRKLKFLGCPGQAAGCLSEFIVMPETSCIPVKDNVTFHEASISEPLAIGLYAVKQVGEIAGAQTGILGFGPIGMSVLLCARALNAGDIMVTDKIDSRLKIAQSSGAFLTCNAANEVVVDKILTKNPGGLDVVFECCGQQDAIENALDIVKPGGKILIIGIPEFDFWSLTADKMRRKEVTIINVRRQNHCTEEAIDMITNKKVDVSGMPTHTFKFADTPKAFELVADYKDGVMKAIIDFDN